MSFRVDAKSTIWAMKLEIFLGAVVACDMEMICLDFDWKLLDKSWYTWIQVMNWHCSCSCMNSTTDCPHPTRWTVRGYCVSTAGVALDDLCTSVSILWIW
jgi:hypothetical protein